MNIIEGIRKNTEVELQIEKLAFGGKAIARIDDFVVFVENAIPGQRVRTLITKKKRQYAEGRAIEVVSQSPDYTVPFCRHFGVCGGCLWQNLSYEEQLRWKRIHVQESLEHVTGLEGVAVEPTVPSPQDKYYRNKMEYTFADRRWLLPDEIAAKEVTYGRDFALGLHVRGFFDKVFNVEECFLESPRSVAILKATREWAAGSGLSAYTTRTHQGFWRFLVVREGKRTDQTLVHCITASDPRQEEIGEGLARHLTNLFPEITTFVHSVSRKKAQVAIGDDSRTLTGPGYIEEHLGGLRFRISAHSFFQTNPLAAEKLYETVRQCGAFSGEETVWDLYCGTGSIALFIASRVRRVVGFEVVEEAITDAYTNCRLNGVENCSFHLGDLKDVIAGAREMAQSSGLPDVIIADPPRAGMHPNVIRALLEMAPRRIVTVSCNPATLARDLGLLREKYHVGKVQPFDLFPYTPHIECVVQLERK
jgi:23S rRNA (uracil1939-C5)-methyltransferase